MRHASWSRERIDSTQPYGTFLKIIILNIIIVRIQLDISNFKSKQSALSLKMCYNLQPQNFKQAEIRLNVKVLSIERGMEPFCLLFEYRDKANFGNEISRSIF